MSAGTKLRTKKRTVTLGFPGHRQVEVEAFAKGGLAYHRVYVWDVDTETAVIPRGRACYTVTHVRTGLCIGPKDMTRAEARALHARLLETTVDWTQDKEGVGDHAEGEARQAIADAVPHGLLRSCLTAGPRLP